MLRDDRQAYRTEQIYGPWLLRYLRYCGGTTSPNRLGTKGVERFLSHLAAEGQVSASTQRRAPNAPVFLHRGVRHTPLEGTIAPIRRKRRPRPLTVLTRSEASAEAASREA